VIVVEHDTEAILAADHVVDLGPAPASTAAASSPSGTPDEIKRNPASLTGQYLSGARAIACRGSGGRVTRTATCGSSRHRQQPAQRGMGHSLALFTCVTGVSGSASRR